MNNKQKHLTLFLFWLFTACGFQSFQERYDIKIRNNQLFQSQAPHPKVNAADTQRIKRDFGAILEKGKLTVLFRNNLTSYFILRGHPMGYEYELLKLFTNYLQVDLEVKLAKSDAELIQKLERGEGDLIAANMMATLDKPQNMEFTKHHSQTRQMLVQRIPKNWRNMKRHQIEKTIIRNPIGLIGKKRISEIGWMFDTYPQ